MWRFLRKLKLPYDPAMPLLGIYLDKTVIQKDICTRIFTAALFTIVKTGKPPKCPLRDEQIRRCGTYIQYSTTQPLKKNETMPFAAA